MRSEAGTLAAVLALLLAGACASTGETPKTRAPSADDEALREIAREHSHELAHAVQLYWFMNQEYPSEEEGLRALLDPPKGKPVFRVMPQDPWGREFRYRRPGVTGNEFDVYSLGPDGKEGTADDVGSWEVRESKEKARPRPRPRPRPKAPPPPSGGRVMEL